MDSKVFSVGVRVGPDDLTFDFQEVAGCRVRQAYMDSNPIVGVLYHKNPGPALITSPSRPASRHLLGLEAPATLSSPVEFRQCAWWNPNFGTNGAWDPSACTTVATDAEKTTCKCRRFGAMAVLREASERSLRDRDRRGCDPPVVWTKYGLLGASLVLLLAFLAVCYFSDSGRIWEDMFHRVRAQAVVCWAAAATLHVVADLDAIRLEDSSNLAVGTTMVYFYSASATWVACEAHATFKAITAGIISGRAKVSKLRQ